jgi:carboxyl-terminal processing protease
MALGDAVEKLRGAPGTTVKVTFMHEGSPQISEMTIKREAIKIESVKDVKMLEPGIGYIRIATFHENTPLEFQAALESIKKEGAQALVVDVRNNAGGLLTAGEHVAEAFVPKGQVIVSTKSRSGKQDKTYFSDNASPAAFHPLVLLVNKGSASSSEIFAGAVQDYGLGTIVGTQTFGKGSVQALVPLPDGSALRLTTSKYYTPKGRSIHETGITPDVAVDSEGALAKAIEICKNTK